LHRAPNRTAQVNLASSDPNQRRGENRYVDPYTGTLLEEPVGLVFFRKVTQLHRWFLTDDLLKNRDLGKHLVGASTVLLILLSVTGIYLRWPRRIFCIKTWLTFSLKRKGRSFLWDMHAVIGTWVLLLYLLASLTGLYWSYDWYRNSLHSISGVPPMARPQTPQTQDQATEQGQGQGRRGQQTPAIMPLPLEQLDVAWTLFSETVENNFSRVAIRIPEKPEDQITMNYLAAKPRHERATDRLVVDPDSKTIVNHDRYDDRPLNVRLMSSMYPLHAGSYFGTTGKVLMMLASLAMPLFTITGWMLYLQRRKNKKTAKRAAATIDRNHTAAESSSTLIAYASQSGFGESIAWENAAKLQGTGYQVQVKPLDHIKPEELSGVSRALFLVSTFGDGVPPDNARNFFRSMAETTPDLSGLHYQLLALGDRNYQYYCHCGYQLDQWLRRNKGKPQFPLIEVDDGDAAALELWDEQLDQIKLNC